MDIFLVLISKRPWNGKAEEDILQKTYWKVRTLPDPDNKVEIITKLWETEADERNYGLQALHQRGIDWCFIADDDELYNTEQLRDFLPTMNADEFVVYLFRNQTYWKNRATILEEDPWCQPSVLCTIPGRLTFSQARMVTVFGNRKWQGVDPEKVVCHHLSYVRTDDQMFRKINHFSHSDEIKKDWENSWYHTVWLPWKQGDIDLHPVNPKSFRGTLPADNAKYKLTPLDHD